MADTLCPLISAPLRSGIGCASNSFGAEKPLGASQALRQIREFYGLGEDALWVTVAPFERACLLASDPPSTFHLEQLLTNADHQPDGPSLSFRQQRTLQRAQGCLLGQIAGDSLGALVEFMTKAEIARRYPNGLRELAHGGPWNILPGQVTDDSELAITLARTLVRERSFDAQRVFEAYADWRNSDPFDIGGTTSRALSLPFSRRDRIDGSSQANGSLMRVSPIGIFAAGDPERAAALAAEDSRLTHPHPACVSACAAFVAAIATGIAGGSRADMMAAAQAYAGAGDGAETIRRVLQLAAVSPPRDFHHQMGWVLIAFQNAFHHLAAGSSLQQAVTATVMQGGDTDTNGAIVGTLVGAADGLQQVPPQWIASVQSCRPARSNRAPQPRPKRYWARDCMELAAALLSAGDGESR